MSRAAEVRVDEGGANRSVSKVAQRARAYETLWTGLTYAITIIAVLAILSTIN
jgi:hypothetical protein